MELEAAIGRAGGDGRMGQQMLHLEADVLLDEGLDLRGALDAGMERFDDAAGGFGVAEPARDGRHALEGGVVGLEQALHGAAIGMAADDDVLHAEGDDGVFDDGRDAAHHLAVGGNDVTDVAADEHVARGRLGDHLGDDAAVGAGDEEGVGVLSGGEAGELFALFREDGVGEFGDALEKLVERIHRRGF